MIKNAFFENLIGSEYNNILSKDENSVTFSFQEDGFGPILYTYTWLDDAHALFSHFPVSFFRFFKSVAECEHRIFISFFLEKRKLEIELELVKNEFIIKLNEYTDNSYGPAKIPYDLPMDHLKMIVNMIDLIKKYIKKQPSYRVRFVTGNLIFSFDLKSFERLYETCSQMNE